MLFGEYQPRNSFERIGYHVGTAASLIGGLYYGATELKIAKGVCSLFRRAMQKSPTYSLKATSSIKNVSKIDKAQVPAHLAKLPEKISIVKKGSGS